jgi:hypothetical protein
VLPGFVWVSFFFIVAFSHLMLQGAKMMSFVCLSCRDRSPRTTLSSSARWLVQAANKSQPASLLFFAHQGR